MDTCVTVCRCETRRRVYVPAHMYTRLRRWGSGIFSLCHGEAAASLFLSLLANYIRCVHKCNPGCTRFRGCSPRRANLVLPPPFPSRSWVPSFLSRTVRQGEMVDSIEYCVNQTGDHVGQARGELIKAEEYRSKARKVKNIRHRTQTCDRDSELGKSLSRVRDTSRYEGPRLPTRGTDFASSESARLTARWTLLTRD